MCTYVLISVHPKLKILYFTNQLSKLNFDYTVMFLTTRSSKLDHTWLYLDDIFKKIFLFVLEHFLFWDNFIMFWNILFDSGTICISGIFLTLTDLCDGMTIVAYAMSRHPRRRPRQASRLRALGPWRARHGRMDHTVSAEQVQLGRRERTWRKKIRQHSSVSYAQVPPTQIDGSWAVTTPLGAMGKSNRWGSGCGYISLQMTFPPIIIWRIF